MSQGTLLRPRAAARDPEATTLGQVGDLRTTSDRSLPLFYLTVSTCLDAGLQIHQALDIAAEQTEDDVLRESIENMHTTLLEGHALHTAFSRFPRIFDDVQRALIKIGEEGSLQVILRRLADIAETRRHYKKRLQASLVMPGVVLSMCLVLNLIAPRIIIPPVYEMLNNLGLSMPWFSQLVFGAAYFFTSLWFWAPAVLVGLIMYKFNSSERYDVTLKRWKAMLFRAPVVSRLIRCHTHAEWAELFAIQLEAGCTPELAISNLRKASIDPNFEEVARKLKAELLCPRTDSDDILAVAMERTGYFEPTLIEFVKVGAEIGKLPAMLNSASKMYSENFQAALDRFEALLSPVLTILTGIIIGSWVVAFILPLAKIVGQL